jgi:chromosome segregation ATPase
MPELPNIGAFGWIGYLGMAIVIAITYFPKAWKESRGEDRESERLTAALEDERKMRKEAEQALKDAHSQIFQQVADFARMNAENATLSERMSHMVREQERLSLQNKEMAQTIREQNEQIRRLNEQVRHLQQTLEHRGSQDA